MPYLGATELVFPAGVSIGTSSVPYSIGAVASLIVEVEGVVDGYVAAAGYGIPVSSTATYSFAVLRSAVKNGVSAQILDALFPNMGGPGDRAQTMSSGYRRAYEMFLKSLRDGSMSLIDASPAAASGTRPFPVGGGVASGAVRLDTIF